MRTPRHIADVSAIALAGAAIVTSAATTVIGRGAFLFTIASTTLAALSLGALVGCGTYLGARLALPEERTDRLVACLGAIYLPVGIVLALPIPTHAVLIDLSMEGARPFETSPPEPLTVTIVVLLSTVPLAAAVTLVLGKVLAVGRRRNA